MQGGRLVRSPKQINSAVEAISGVPEQAPANVDQQPNSSVMPERVGKLEIYPLANLFPMGPKDDLQPLADSIAKNGLLNPAVTFDGKILDGRRRAAACVIADVELRTTPLPDGIDPVEFVLAQNLQRRHLSPSQRATVAAKLMPHYQTEAAGRKRVLSGTRANPDGSQPEVPATLPEPAEHGEAREMAAKVAGAKPRYVSDAVRLLREAPELFKQVEFGEITIPQAIQRLEKQRDERPEQETGVTRNDFLAVLWDDSDAPPTRAPEKSYGPKSYPNLAFFRFHQSCDSRIELGTKHDLTHVALFAVPVEPSLTIKDKDGRAFCKASCQFLALSIRGTIPEPASVPAQIIEEGYEGVVKMIELMFPDALRAISTTRAEAPNGWQLVPRRSGPDASSKASVVTSGSTLSGTPSAGVCDSPSPAALPAKVSDGTPAKVEGRLLRKAKAITVRDHLCKLCDGLGSIAAELRQRQTKVSGIMRNLHSFKARGHAITTLEKVTKQLASVLASVGILGDSNRGVSGSVGDLPFSTRIVPRGSWYKCVGQVIEIVTALAKTIQAPAPKVHQDLQDIAAQLTRLRKQGGF